MKVSDARVLRDELTDDRRLRDDLHLDSLDFIGVVSAIVGITSYRLTFMGRADHAGTTSMQDRRDASQGASAFALGAREIVLGQFPNCGANVGNMTFTPGAFNIVPAGVTVSLEFRGPDADELARLETEFLVRLKTQLDPRWVLAHHPPFSPQITARF